MILSGRGIKARAIRAMNIVVSAVGGIALAFHMLLGCCWHHTHSADGQTGTPNVAQAAAATCAHGHRHAPTQEDGDLSRQHDPTGQQPSPQDPSDHQCPSNPCGEPDCAVVASKPAFIANSSAATCFGLVTFAPAAMPAEPQPSGKKSATSHASPPQRLYPAHQVLLI